MYSDISKRISSIPKIRANCRVTSVFPTPVGPAKRNEAIGFSVQLPEGYKFSDERNDVVLFYGGGPVGDDISFEHGTEVGKNITINHVDAYNDPVFEIFEEYHKSDQYLVEEVEELAWNAALVKHRDGVLLILKAENTNQYFEFIVYREGENTEDILMEMYKSFKMISN